MDPIKKTEFSLVRGQGDGEQGLYTSASEGAARIKAVQLLDAGEPADTLRLVKRTATYPTDKAGKPQAAGSTVDSEDLPL